MAKSKKGKPVSPPEERIEKKSSSITDNLFEKTGGICIPLELTKDVALSTKDWASSLFWKARGKIRDAITVVKIAKNYDVEYVENPGEGEPIAKIVPKDAERTNE